MDTHTDPLDPDRRFRPLIADVDRALQALFEANRGTGAREDLAYDGARERLSLAWSALVTGMALAAAPELRRCPHCSADILRIATRCRYCMQRSPAEAAGEVQGTVRA